MKEKVMPRYIDADALLKAMNTWDKFGFSHSGAFVREPENHNYVPYVHYDDMVKCVKGMPTVDAVEVVRCKECIHSAPNGKYGCTVYHYRLYDTHEMTPDDFCSRGERRES